jgi:hypothetical protein
VVGYFLDECGDATVDYLITNPSPATPTVSCNGKIPSAFEGPVHKYDALELTFNRNFSNNWGLLASYRYAKLKGNFEGFYRSDNGQSDPAISSLFDFPTNDPSYTQIGVPQFGFGGDIRFQGATLGEGVLPNDRPHQVKIYGSYSLGSLNLGAGFNWGTGRSLTLLDSNPAYNNAGEIPDTLRGGGIQTSDGFLKRTSPTPRARRACGLRDQDQRQAEGGLDGGRVQPVQPADRHQLRQLPGPQLPGGEPNLVWPSTAATRPPFLTRLPAPSVWVPGSSGRRLDVRRP